MLRKYTISRMLLIYLLLLLPLQYLRHLPSEKVFMKNFQKAKCSTKANLNYSINSQTDQNNSGLKIIQE